MSMLEKARITAYRIETLLVLLESRKLQEALAQNPNNTHHQIRGDTVTTKASNRHFDFDCESIVLQSQKGFT